MFSRFSCVQLFVTLWTVAHQDPRPQDSPGKNTGVGCHTLLQGIFPTQGSNPCLLCLLHCRWILYPPSHLGITVISLFVSCCCSDTQLCPTLCHPVEQARLPCPSLSPWVCSNSCPLSQWCYPPTSTSMPLKSPALAGRFFITSATFVVQSHSRVRLFVTPWTVALPASLSFTISWGLLKLMSIELGMPSNHLIICHPLLLLPSVFPSIRVFSNELALCISWPKYWSFSFSISPSNEHSRFISFRID